MLRLTPVERRAIDPDAVEDYGDLPGDGDLCLSRANPLGKLHSRDLERRPFLRPMKQNGRRLEKVRPEKTVAPSGYLAIDVSFVRLASSRCKAQIGADAGCRSEARWIIDRMAERDVVTTLTPETVIRRRVVSSDFAN
ncbi:hypothetical protein ABIE71_000325 [Bradyrhizobium diazoefficiens]